MVVLFGVVVLVLVFVIAAVVVGREARRLDSEPPRPVFDMDAAVAWIAEHLPFEVSAVLSYDDVRRIVDWNLEFFRSRGVSSNGSTHHTDHPVVVGGAETVAHGLEKALETGDSFTAAQLHAVLEAQMAYLERIGAIGPEAPPDDAI